MASTCLYREVHPPTGVTHAMAGYVMHTAEESPHPELVVARGTELAVYAVRKPSKPSTAHTSSEAGTAVKDSARLEPVCRYPLNGVVESLSILKSRSQGQRDAVLLTFRDAKLVVLEWCAANWTMRVSSMHSMEGEPTLKQGKQVFSIGPRVLTDPQGRFAAVLFYDNQLAVLPAIEADHFAQMAAQGAPATSAPVSGPAPAVPAPAGRELALAHPTAPTAIDDPQATQPFGSAAALGNSYVLDLAHIGGTSGLVPSGGAGGGGGGGAGQVGGPGREGRSGGSGRGGRAAATAAPLQPGIQEVRDAVLLHGYLEPVLLVLHQPDPAWAGRYRERKDVSVVSAVSLSIRRKKQAVLWVGTGLPADALKLVAVPGRPAALLITPVAILVVQQGSQYGIAVHSAALPGPAQPRLEFTATEPPHVTASRMAAQYACHIAPELLPAAYKGINKAPGIEADLRGAAATWLGTECCLISCTSGLQLAVTLLNDGPLNKRVQVTPVTMNPVPPPSSCLADLSGGLVFMGTMIGDSMLMRKTIKSKADQGQRLRKRARLGDGTVKVEGDGDIEDAADSDDGGSGVDESEDGEGTRNGSGAPRMVYRMIDSLMGLGPVRDVLHVDTSTIPGAGGESGGRGAPTIFAAVGGDHSSAVALLRPGIVPELVTEVPVPGILGMWAVHYRRDDVMHPLPENVGDGALLDPSTLNKAQGGQGSAQYHAYLLLTKDQGRTMVLETGEELQEVTEKCCYVTSAPTLAAGNLFNLAVICQVLPKGVHIYDGQEELQSLSVEELLLGHVPQGAAITITHAQIQDPYVLLQLSNGRAILLEGDMWSLTLSMCTAAGTVLCPPLPGAAAAALGPGSAPPPPRMAAISTCCLYEDGTGWLARLAPVGASDQGNSGTVMQGALNGQVGAAPPLIKPELMDVPTAGTAEGASLGTDGEMGVDEVGAGMDWTAQAGTDGAKPPAVVLEGGAAPDVQEAVVEAPTMFLAVGRVDGRLDVYRLPGMDPVFCCAHAGGGAELLLQRDDRVLEVGPPCPATTRLVEIRIESFKEPTPGGFPECERPVMMALTAAGTLVVYQAYNRCSTAPANPSPVVRVKPEGESLSQGHPEPKLGDHMGHVGSRPLRLAWRRVHVDWISHQEATGGAGQRPGIFTPRRLTRFDGVSYLSPDDTTPGPLQSGMFLAGTRPLWLVAARGGLVPHPMTIDGPVTAITPFHNVNCPQGFIMACFSGTIKVGHLPTRERLDTPWATRKVKLPKVVVQRLAFLRESGLLAVSASRRVPSRPRLPEEPGGDPHAVAAYAGEMAMSAAVGEEEGHEVRLLQLPGLTPVPGLRPLSVHPNEAITCVKSVTLKVEVPLTPAQQAIAAATGADVGQEAKTVTLLALGTTHALGEDYPCLGRIVLYRVDRKGLSGWAATVFAIKDTAGPVTCLHEFKGMLLAAVGKTVELYTLRQPSQAAALAAGADGTSDVQPTLVKTAFYDSRLLITGLAVVKDFLLVADVHQGCAFVRYTEASKVLELLSRDFDYHDLVSAGFLINAAKLLFAAPDAGGTLRQFEFVKSHPAAWGGQRLVPGGTLHIGQMVTRMTGIKMFTPDGANRHGLLVSTVSGSWGCWAPIWDASAAARLQALQRVLLMALPHMGGLNPRAFRRRHLRTPRALGGGEHWGPQQAPDKSMLPQGANVTLHAATGSVILDADLLWRYTQLPRAQQAALAAEAGAHTPEQLFMDLTAWAVATTT